LQRGMNFRLPASGRSVILMSRRPNAPYVDRLENEGRTIVYEGHDIPRSSSVRDPKTVDQETRAGARLTQNGLFLEAANATKLGKTAESVRVYEKLRDGIWVFNGTFALVDAWSETSGRRKVFKFKLNVQPSRSDEHLLSKTQTALELEHDRIIPSAVKVEVFKRDQGRCVRCGRADNLHFDHVLPFSRGGTSLTPENIQLLCVRHNLEKAARIE